MNEGRELDALIAEKVFSYTLDYEFADMMFDGAPCVKELRSYDDEWGVLPFYSSDIGDAWFVVEYFRSLWDEGDLTDRFWSFKDCGISQGGWQVRVEVCPDHDGCAAIYKATASTLAEAICLAALRSRGVEV